MKNYQSLFLILFAAILVSSCDQNINVGCLGTDSSVEERTLEYDDFDALEIKIPCRVFIKEGPIQEVLIESAGRVLDKIADDANVRNNTFELSVKRCLTLNKQDIKVFLTMPSLTKIKIDGSADIVIEDVFKNIEDLQIEINGDADVELPVEDADKITVDLDGDGDVRLSGSAKELDISTNGHGRIVAPDLLTESAQVDIDGKGTCNLTVSKELNIKLKGRGEVKAKGTADLQTIDIIGTGEVRAFELDTKETRISINGLGNCEVNVSEILDVEIVGAGKICYMGNPTLMSNIIGDGSLNDCN